MGGLTTNDIAAFVTLALLLALVVRTANPRRLTANRLILAQ